MPRNYATIDTDLLRSYYSYDPETGFLHVKKPNPVHPIGGVIGARCPDGYITVVIKRRHFLGHRLAWQLFYGEPAPCAIDHINGIRDDNRIANLRLATTSQNNANARACGRHGLLKGVRRTPNGKFWAAVCKDRRETYLGVFETEEEAHAAYLEGARRVHGEFTIAPERTQAREVKHV
jgi:hypothetical protein